MSVSPVPFAPETLETIQRAFRVASDRRHDMVGLEHLLLAATEEPEARRILGGCGVDVDALRVQLDAVLTEAFPTVPASTTVHPEPSLGFDRVIQQAVVHATVSSAEHVDSASLLVFLLQEEDSHAAHFLREHGVDRLTLLRVVSHGAAAKTGSAADSAGDDEVPLPQRDPLEAFASDLVARAAIGGIDPLIGRVDELERMIQVLCRRRKNNPLLVGEPGVGKTALAEGLALRIHEGAVPEALTDARVYSLDLGSLVAGTRYRGDFEERVKQVLVRLESEQQAILFIDEIHALVGAGAASGGAMDAGSLLKPALASGTLRCIGATTFNDAKQSFDRDRALSRRFQKIEVGEPNEAETRAILEGLREHYESHHGVRYTDAALDAAVALSAKHLRDVHLPDKAIDVLDETGAAHKLMPVDQRPEVIEAADVERVVARMARVPVQIVSSDDRRALATLGDDLRGVLFGQGGAIDEVVSAIRLSRSGLRAVDKPIGSFLFSGPTGVGKTELARQLARMLGVEFLRYDMSEYMEKHAVSRLIGAPPGYVGYEEGGLLIDAVRKSPHAVLLLDEVEKAHADMFSILLQVMDHATLTDSHGRKADFRYVILIMTTNAGVRDLSDRRLGFSEAGQGGSSRGAVERTFSPEFRNRLDAVVAFNPLGTAEIERVVDKQFEELRVMVEVRGVGVELTLEARAWLTRRGFDRAFGARPMARLIEKTIKKPLSEAMLFGDLIEGGAARVIVRDDDLVVDIV
jgi:ATP-dependent Clp protease ATP-binding subunit ClpA